MERLVIVMMIFAAVGPPAVASHPFDLMQPADGPIARHFEAPAGPYGPGHRGVDLAVPVGSPVVAAAGGVVAFAGQVGGSLFVSIDHPSGTRTTYSFLSGIAVGAGDAVDQGDLVATSGAGHAGSAEPHLHFGLRVGSDYRDPEPVLLESIRRNLWRVVRLAG